MGAALGGGKRGGGRGRSRSKPMSDINVTPLVDVMLVLLIIFMVTAPLLTAGVQVDLPKTNAGAIKGDDKPITVSVDVKGRIWLQETEVQLEELAPRMKAITAAKPDTRIFVRGDKGIHYGRVMEVMGNLSAGGFSKVALIAEQQQPAAPARQGAR